MNRISQAMTLLTVFALALLVSVPAAAQTAAGTILGTVTDETGGVLPGVEVTVTNLDTGAVRGTISDDEGRYRVPEVPPGNYEISAALVGFTTAVRSGISMAVNRQARVDLALSVGEISERVVVTGEAPQVDTTSSTIAGLVDENKIRDLPLNGRSFTDLVTLQMGTALLNIGASNSASGFGKKISIAGQRPSANSFLLDGNFVNGVLNNSPGGATGLLLGVETLREFSVLTNTYSAEYGQSMGGIINAVTKSGTNEFHGSVFYFHRNDNMDATNFFTNSGGQDKPEFRRHQFGFTAGGPIVPDKTFIFGGYEGLRESRGTTRTFGTLTDEVRACGLGTGPCDAFTDPTTNEPVVFGPGITDYFVFFPPAIGPRDPANGIGEGTINASRVADEDNFVVKIDHNLTESNSLFGRYTFDDAMVLAPIISFDTNFTTRNQYLTLEDKHIFSPTLLNVARVGFSRSALVEIDNPRVDFDPSLKLVPTAFSALPEFDSNLLGTFNPPGTGGGFGVNIGGSTVTPRIYFQNLFEYADTVNWTRDRHSVKFGFNLKRVQGNLISPQRTFGSIQFGTIFDFYAGRGAPLSFITQDSSVQRGMRYWVMGFFVQDDWQVTPGLTLNLGLRYEPHTEHDEVNGRLTNLRNIRTDTELTVGKLFENPSKQNWAPRIGFAYDPFGEGKTAIRGGFGMFYNIQMSELDRISATSNPPFTTIATVNTGTFPYDFADCCGSAGAVSRTSLELIDFNAPQSYSMQWNLNVQHQVMESTTLTVGYVGSRGVDLFRVYQWNQPDPVSPDQCGPGDGPTCVNPQPDRSPYYWPAFGDRPANSFLFGDTCPGAGFFRCPRLNPGFDAVIQRSGGANSWYNGLQIQIERRFSDGFQFQFSYDWSHGLDNSSKQIRGPGESFQTASTMNSLDTPGDKSNSNFDITHNFRFNYTIDLPGRDLAGAAGKVLGGWQLGGIVSLASGVPETILLGYDNCRCLSGEVFGVGATDNRPDLVGDSKNLVIGDGRDPRNYFDGSSANFVPAPDGFHGNAGRNILRIPGVAQFDLSFIKETAMAEGVELQFRFEAFNIFNRANFADPDTRLFFGAGRPNGNIGRITNTTTTSRELQLALKLVF